MILCSVLSHEHAANVCWPGSGYGFWLTVMGLYQSSQIPAMYHSERTHVASSQERMDAWEAKEAFQQNGDSWTDLLALEQSSPIYFSYWPPAMCLKYKMDRANSVFNTRQWLQIIFNRKSTFTWNARSFMTWPFPVSSVSSAKTSPISLHSRHTTLSISLKAPTHLCSLFLLFRTPFPAISARWTPFQNSAQPSSLLASCYRTIVSILCAPLMISIAYQGDYHPGL